MSDSPPRRLGWKHLYWILPVALVMLTAFAVVVALVAGSIVQRVAASRTDPVPTEAADGGFSIDPLGTAPVHITVYVDYLCPYCGQFEQTNGETIEEWIEAGDASLVVHPIAILTSRSNGTKYSERAASAAACVGTLAPGSFYAFHTALFANQPAEGTDGLSDDALVELAANAAAAGGDDVAACIRGGDYRSWVQDMTERAIKDDGVVGTPTILVNGEQYTGSLTDTASFAAFVAQQH
ncbi:thioredoxin domain-containing protein [Microbacteriaceae bacterium VKM Ac-2855]|nr:thioredoxin domain-containing protein [Microbacteriaceae bacterium VKM Ac-2855]